MFYTWKMSLERKKREQVKKLMKCLRLWARSSRTDSLECTLNLILEIVNLFCGKEEKIQIFLRINLLKWIFCLTNSDSRFKQSKSVLLSNFERTFFFASVKFLLRSQRIQFIFILHLILCVCLCAKWNGKNSHAFSKLLNFFFHSLCSTMVVIIH